MPTASPRRAATVGTVRKKRRSGIPGQPPVVTPTRAVPAAAPPVTGGTTGVSPAPGNPGPWPAPGPLDPLAHQAGNDGLTTAGLSNVQRGIDQGQAGFAHQEQALQRGYGFGAAQAGEAGAIQDPATGRWFKIDVQGNPYSQAAQLKQQWETRQRARSNNDAAGGFAYDGSAARGEISDQRGERRDTAALSQSFLDGQMSIAQQKQQMMQQAIDQALGIHGDQLERDATRELPGQGDPDGDERVQDPTKISASTPAGSHPPHENHGDEAKKRRRRRRKPKGKR